MDNARNASKLRAAAKCPAVTRFAAGRLNAAADLMDAGRSNDARAIVNAVTASFKRTGVLGQSTNGRRVQALLSEVMA